MAEHQAAAHAVRHIDRSNAPLGLGGVGRTVGPWVDWAAPWGLGWIGPHRGRNANCGPRFKGPADIYIYIYIYIYICKYTLYV